MKNTIQQSIRLTMFATIAAFPFSAAVGFAGIIIALILSIGSGDAGKLWRLAMRDTPLLLLVGSFSLSILLSGLLGWSLGVGIFAGCQLGLYLLVRAYLRENQDIQRAINITLAVSILVSAYGIYQYYFTDMNAVAQGWVDPRFFNDIPSRVFSTLFNPNVLGSYLIFAISTALGCFQYANRKRGLFLGTVIAIGVVCLLFTYSRGAWLALAFSIVLFLYWRQEKKYVLGIIVIGIVVLSVAFPHLWTRINPLTLRFDTSTSYRLEIWKTSLQIIRDHPLWGTGLGTLWYYIPQYSKTISTFIAHAHNMYLQLAAEAGLLGLSSFLFFVGITMRNIFIAFKSSRSPRHRGIALGLLVGFTGILVQGFVDAAIIAPQFGMLFWIYSGIGKNICENGQVGKREGSVDICR